MLGSVGEDHILAKEILTFRNGTIPAKAVGRLVEIIDDARVSLHFEGRGRVVVSRCDIMKRSFALGSRVRLVGEFVSKLEPVNKIPDGAEGVVVDIWISSSFCYLYRVRFDDNKEISFEASRLRTIPETVEEPMVISELAKHMIAVGTGCNHRSVPEWFQPVVNVLGGMPKLSQMDPAQLEFIIKKFMEYRRVDCRSDLVANVLFGIQSSASSQQMRNVERNLHGYKEKLDAEWKKLDKIIPIEFQYAALKAYVETQNG